MFPQPPINRICGVKWAKEISGDDVASDCFSGIAALFRYILSQVVLLLR